MQSRIGNQKTRERIMKVIILIVFVKFYKICYSCFSSGFRSW